MPRGGFTSVTCFNEIELIAKQATDMNTKIRCVPFSFISTKRTAARKEGGGMPSDNERKKNENRGVTGVVVKTRVNSPKDVLQHSMGE